MRRWICLVVLLAEGFTGCATVNEDQQRYHKLSPECRDEYDKYRQFMTEEGQGRYLAALDDESRHKMVADLHIEERLGRYPEYIRTAIWSRTPVVGMDKAALFLTLGKPDSVDRLDFDPETHVLPSEKWYYRRGALANQSYVITLVNSEITEVKEPEVK